MAPVPIASDVCTLSYELFGPLLFFWYKFYTFHLTLISIISSIELQILNYYGYDGK